MVQEGGPGTPKKPVAAVIIVVMGVGAVAALGYYTFESGKCTGYPPGGDCAAPYSYSFLISVNYTGPWRLAYTGQTNVGESDPTNVTGTRTGSGYYSTQVALSGLNDRMLTLCVQAQKQDGSNSTLFLSTDPPYPTKNTSMPYGSVSACVGVAP